MAFSSERFKQMAHELGFNIAGVIPAQPVGTLAAYFHWIDQEMHGRMGYMARPDRQMRRRDLSVILPGVRSMLLVGLDYFQSTLTEQQLADPSRGRIARYAWGMDYHDVMTKRLEELAAWLKQELPGLSQRVYVDTGAILERGHGQEAGLGFIGKNTMLIHPRRGSYFFLGEILLDVEFDHYDIPARRTMCGSCTRCLAACPTDAFPRPYVLDARRCISYLTIEHKGYIDDALRPLMGNWVFGCDVCQDVCPWQRFALESKEPAFQPRNVRALSPLLTDLLSLDDAAFSVWYGHTPISRIRRERMVRNACIAAGNWGHHDAAPLLGRLLTDASPLVRSHAAWGLARIAQAAARKPIMDCVAREPDADAKQDMRITLDSLE
jgi:epoxyqueuosine reductase